MNIVFITATRIGDAILSTGLLNWLHTTYPHANFTIITSPLSANLFQDFPAKKNLIAIQKKPFSGHWLEIWARLVGTKWDMVIDLRRSVIGHFLTTQRLYHIPKDKSEAGIHRLKLNAMTLGLSETPPPKIWLKPHHFQKAQTLRREADTVIAIGPSANWFGKSWAAENFIALHDRLTQQTGGFAKAKFAIIAAENERAQAEPILNALPKTQRLNLIGNQDLQTIAAFLKGCALYIGNDSGLMHLAAAMDTPTLGLFGPSRHQHYAPIGRYSRFIRTTTSYENLMQQYDSTQQPPQNLMTSLSVDMVYDAIQAMRKDLPLHDTLT